MANQKVEREFYKILVLGPTGKGKTDSFRDMDKARTGFINSEDKPLTFEGGFKYHARPRKFAGIMKALQDYADNSEIDVIVLDSMSAAFAMLVEEMRTNFSGFDIWNNFNKQVGEMLTLIKRIKKEVFVTGHYEILNIEGESEKRLKVKGKEWEGQIEREFVLVVYAQDKWKDDRPEYFFKLAAEGTSAKCPTKIRKLFGEDVYSIPNDSRVLLDKVVEFSTRSAVVAEELFS